MTENHTSSSSPTSYFFENSNGSIFPSDLVLTMMDDGSSSTVASSSSSSLNSSTNSNGSLSPSGSHQSLGLSSTSSSSSPPMSFPCCIFRSRPNSHPFQERCIPLNEPVKVGRAVARLKALTNNAIFDCKVLSRQHAKLWYENGKVRSKNVFFSSHRIDEHFRSSSFYKIQKVPMERSWIIKDWANVTKKVYPLKSFRVISFSSVLMWRRIIAKVKASNWHSNRFGMNDFFISHTQLYHHRSETLP